MGKRGTSSYISNFKRNGEARTSSGLLGSSSERLEEGGERGLLGIHC